MCQLGLDMIDEFVNAADTVQKHEGALALALLEAEAKALSTLVYEVSGNENNDAGAAFPSCLSLAAVLGFVGRPMPLLTTPAERRGKCAARFLAESVLLIGVPLLGKSEKEEIHPEVRVVRV